MPSMTIRTFLLAAIAGPYAAAGMDFSPQFIPTQQEGAVIERPSFTDGTKRYAFRIDSDTRLTGSSEAVTCSFENLVRASMEIREAGEAGPFDEKAREAFREIARAKIPRDATAVTLEKELEDPYRINGWKSFGLIFSYGYFGVPTKRSIVFLNFDPNRRLVVDIRADAEQFDAASARSWRILNSLHEVTPGEQSGAAGG